MGGTTIPLVRKPDGELGELAADDDGRLLVSTDALPPQTALPEPGTPGAAVYVVPSGEQPKAGAIAVTLATDEDPMVVSRSPDDPPVPVTGRVSIATEAKGSTEGATPTATDVNGDRTALDVFVQGGDQFDAIGGTLANITDQLANPLPLPTGTSTLEEQQTQTAQLASLVSQTDGLEGSAASTAINTSATATNTASSATSLSSIDAGVPNALGGAGGMKVEGVAGGQAVAISAASLPLPTGAALETTLGTRASESTLATRASESTLATRASETTAASTLAAVDTLEANTDQIEGKLGTLAAQEATTAKDASVDGLEALGAAGNASTASAASSLTNIAPGIPDALGQASAAASLPAVLPSTQSSGEIAQQATLATRAADSSVDGLEALGAAGNATTAAINTKLLAALGTAFAPPVRATATNTATQLANVSYTRGFLVENIDSANDLYVGASNAVTTSNGFRISPSRSRRFDLPNSNLLWVISASTTAYQIGATT